MPSVIDSLIVELSLDPRRFVEGSKQTSASLKKTREDADTTAKELELSGKRGGEFYGQLAKGATAFLSVIAASDLTRFAVSQVNSISSMGRAALALGMSVQSVDAFGKAVERVGGTRQGATGTLQNLRGMTESAKLFGQVDPRQAAAMGRIGATYGDDPLEIVKKFADWSQKQKSQADITAWGNVLGLDEGTINLARTRGRSGINAELRAAPTINDDEAKRAQKAQYDLHLMLQTLTTDLDKLGLSSDAAAVGLGALLVVVKGLAALKFLQVLTKGGGAAPAVAAAASEGGGMTAGAVGGGLAAGGFGLALAGGVGLALIPTRLGDGTIAGMNPYGINNPKAHARLFYMKSHGGAEPPAAFWADWNADMAKRGQPTGGAAGGGNDTVAAHVAAFLLAHGVSKAATSGILAGITAEGGLNPNAFNGAGGGNGAYGIGQWRSTRLTALRKMYGSDGARISLDHQLQFMLAELQGRVGSEGKHGRTILGAADSTSAMQNYLAHYMRPGDGLAGDLRRGGRALGGTTVTINTLTINAPNARDAASATKAGLEAALGRSRLAAQANGAFR